MILLKSFGSLISIPTNQSFVIYDIGYCAENNGQKLEKNDPRIASGQYYEYGDIYIEAGQVKYIYSKVYASYDWVEEINSYIASHINDENIVVDLDELVNLGEGRYREFDGIFSYAGK